MYCDLGRNYCCVGVCVDLEENVVHGWRELEEEVGGGVLILYLILLLS
tara:strand:- start:775 stop:918 length:144 start_codon:yes stop_codon:yes gene_type:complete